ncbi:DUF5412 family protein [Ruminiclostridium josui]|uniref:DUF5412 family protein n=1 Tax=Ruminiclostridium josui TaxID=1499 RepID=UPI0004631937|nr:DUF5412 family protein [Ruminiclostridium josui]
MKKKFLVIVIIALLSYLIYWSFFDMGRLPKDRLISEVESPSGEYSIKVYISESSLSAPAVLGELNYKKIKKKPKNIYWDYKKETADIKWIDNVTVIINGHKLNILHDTYDWRNK